MLSRLAYWIGKTGVRNMSNRVRAEGWLMFWTGCRYVFQENLPADTDNSGSVIKRPKEKTDG